MASTTAKLALGIGCLLLMIPVTMLATCAGCIALVGTSMEEVEQEKAEALKYIKIEDVTSEWSGNYITISGRVRNNGQTPVGYVKVGVDILDSSGGVIDTDWTYAVSGTDLQPGSAKSFRIMVEDNPRFSKYRYYVVRE